MENSTEAISDLTQQVNKLEADNKALRENNEDLLASIFDIRWQTTCKMTKEYIVNKYTDLKDWKVSKDRTK